MEVERLKKDLDDYKKLNADNHRKFVQTSSQVSALEYDLIKLKEDYRKLANSHGKVSKDAEELYGLLVGFTVGEYTLEHLKKELPKFKINNNIFVGGK